MKHILTAFLFASLCGHLPAADPVVIVHSATRITVDAVECGKPADAIANNPQLASAIQHALEKWAAELQASKADADADLAALKSRISSVLQGMLEAELKTGEGPRTAVLRKLIAESQKTDKQLKLEALEAEIAAKQKEAAELAK